MSSHTQYLLLCTECGKTAKTPKIPEFSQEKTTSLWFEPFTIAAWKKVNRSVCRSFGCNSKPNLSTLQVSPWQWRSSEDLGLVVLETGWDWEWNRAYNGLILSFAVYKLDDSSFLSTSWANTVCKDHFTTENVWSSTSYLQQSNEVYQETEKLNVCPKATKNSEIVLTVPTSRIWMASPLTKFEEEGAVSAPQSGCDYMLELSQNCANLSPKCLSLPPGRAVPVQHV